MGDPAEKLDLAELWLVDTGTGHVYPLVDGFRVGRVEGSLILAGDGSVSSRHCVFYVQGNAVEIEDVGSRNGTFVGGGRIESKTRIGLTVGAVIEIGGSRFEVKRRGELPKPRRTELELQSLSSQILPDNIPTRTPAAWAAKARRDLKRNSSSRNTGSIARQRPKKSAQAAPVLRRAAAIAAVAFVIAVGAYNLLSPEPPPAPSAPFAERLKEAAVTVRSLEREYKETLAAAKSGKSTQEDFLKFVRARVIPNLDATARHLAEVEAVGEREKAAKAAQLVSLGLWKDQLNELTALLETKDDSHYKALAELEKKSAAASAELDKAIAELRRPASP